MVQTIGCVQSEGKPVKQSFIRIVCRDTWKRHEYPSYDIRWSYQRDDSTSNE